ncbi:MAG TPA: hypothetical protein VN812_07675 [Candidatus Acidoferrales bacterium]|nr:hypothetical protein [Candidatus Acidoferrales bacterium]
MVGVLLKQLPRTERHHGIGTPLAAGARGAAQRRRRPARAGARRQRLFSHARPRIPPGCAGRLDGQAAKAAEALEYAQSFSKDGNRTQEPFIAQALAQARLEAGEPARARAMAETARDDCLEIGARVCAIDSALVLSAALRGEMGLGAAARIDDVLPTADRLIAETGACNMTAFVLVERAALSELRGEAQQRKAYLRDALEGFSRMGATGHAARLTRELNS